MCKDLLGAEVHQDPTLSIHDNLCFYLHLIYLLTYLHFTYIFQNLSTTIGSVDEMPVIPWSLSFKP